MKKCQSELRAALRLDCLGQGEIIEPPRNARRGVNGNGKGSTSGPSHRATRGALRELAAAPLSRRCDTSLSPSGVTLHLVDTARPDALAQMPTNCPARAFDVILCHPEANSASFATPRSSKVGVSNREKWIQG